MSDHDVVLLPVACGLRELGGFPDGSDSNGAYNAGDLGSIPGSGRSPAGGNGNPLQDFCLENSMCVHVLCMYVLCVLVCVCEHMGVYVLLCVMSI